ncbi:hypothetical protein L3Q82_012223 [Scortum barcoo]|uniref:Uncharacterized protein n=1 Tax=Scortum barcoo TaxID=214431 RepID=A0ACB8W652_9TELE|nr:hypothetical protein L3Q82_012223 [Scortum barcoo]
MLHSLKPCELQTGGFCFENSRSTNVSVSVFLSTITAIISRNAVLESTLSEVGLKAPNARKTGTTIAGIVYKDGVILGADTRATDDMVVADKNCMKIHYIAPKIYCCGAGVAADAEITTQIMSSNVELHMLNTGRPPLVAMVTRQLKQMLFRYQGHIGSSLIVGGVDVTGAHLYSVYPHGSYDKLPFLTMGSGAAAAVSVFEDRFKPNMEITSPDFENTSPNHDDIIEQFSDLYFTCLFWVGIVSQVVISWRRRSSSYETPSLQGFSVTWAQAATWTCVLSQRPEWSTCETSYDKPTTKGKREGQYRYKPGTSAVLTKTVTPLSVDVVNESVQIMDTE